MNNQLRNPSRTLGVAALLAQSLVFFACSSSSPATGTGGTTGSVGGTTGSVGGGGGASVGGGGAGGPCTTFPGSCTCAGPNPDTADGGACTSTCESSSCVTACTQDCCVPCGIDSAGNKTCTCMTPGLPFNNCTCLPPAGFPAGLTGGTCLPQGYAATTAPAGAISLKGMPCNILNAVCFTTESTPTSGRGCICMSDNTLHCGSVNKWFTQVAGTTAYMQ